MERATLDQARAAKPEAMRVFATLGEVVGVGITRVGEAYAVKVNLAGPPADGGATLPATVAGVPVVVEIVGSIRKQPA